MVSDATAVTTGSPWVERREIGPCVLYLGDCLEMLAAGAIPAKVAIVADPPYGVGYQHGGGGKHPEWSRAGDASRIVGDDRPWTPRPWLDLAAIACRSKSSAKLGGWTKIALFGADNYCDEIPPRVGAWYTWDKSAGGGGADSFADSEIIWMGTRNARRVYRQLWKGRCRCADKHDTNTRFHVSQKPVGLMAWVIETLRVPVGALVCDPYMGSGSTGIACIRTGRRFIGIEIDPGHFATACARIDKAWAEANAV